MRKLIAFVLFLIFSVAQLTAQPSDNGVMENNGKSYVVMAVCITILAGLFFYIISIDRKKKKKKKRKD